MSVRGECLLLTGRLSPNVNHRTPSASARSRRRFAGLLLVIAILGVVAIAASLRPPESPLPLGSPFPELSLEDWTTGAARRFEPRGAKPTLVLVVHTACQFCAEEMAQLDANRAQLDARLVVVTPETAPPAAYMSRWSRLEQDSTIVWVRGRASELKRLLRVHATPSLYVYDSSAMLRKSFRGLTDVDAIAKAINSAASR